MPTNAWRFCGTSKCQTRSARTENARKRTGLGRGRGDLRKRRRDMCIVF